jgi:hypothetical protein
MFRPFASSFNKPVAAARLIRLHEMCFDPLADWKRKGPLTAFHGSPS